jgi:phospholipid/cholesterol/gamma-HCH transport system ATP-binding protein
MANALVVENIHKSFKSKNVLNGASMSIEEGAICGMIGPSGAGKSILLKIIGGVIRPTSGRVNLTASHVSLMFQEGALFDSMTVFDNIAFPLVKGISPCANLGKHLKEEVHSKVSDVLSRVGLSKAAYKMPAQLSGGMRRRVSFARAIVARPALVLLDDPTSGLDPVASSVIMNLIVEVHKEYKPTVLIVSQDLRRLFPVVDKIFALFQGNFCFSGTLSDLKKTEPSLLRTFAACRYDLAA